MGGLKGFSPLCRSLTPKKKDINLFFLERWTCLKREVGSLAFHAGLAASAKLR